MKKLINSPENLVHEMIHGIVYAHPELSLNAHYKFIYKTDLNHDKVTLISGGGSGHEPAHAGFIGEGMLDAAVCGDVFASPSQIQVYQAITRTASNKGTLLIIKNYSGDMMNFKNAADLAKEEGIHVDYVKVDDDVAVNDSLYTVGRRGVAGTVFVHKIAGAAASKGLSLTEVKRVAEHAAARIKSFGFALEACTMPSSGEKTFQLAESEIEFGVGIHGEPGRSRQALQSAAQLADQVVKILCDSFAEAQVETKRVALLVNGFGATPLQELYLFNKEVTEILLKKELDIVYTLVGNYMTSIDMEGASLSILALDEELESLLVEPCDTAALKLFKVPQVLNKSAISAKIENAQDISEGPEKIGKREIENQQLSFDNMIYLIKTMGDIIIDNEAAFSELDSHAGDGDFGASIAKGFRELRANWRRVTRQSGDIGELLSASALIIMEYCGGASGPIWGSAFRAAGLYAEGKQHLSVSEVADMLAHSVNAIQKTGERAFGRGAQLGDKTLIDALIPTVQAWREAADQNATLKEAFVAGSQAAIQGAKATEAIVARMGRAGTVGERSLGHPDAGAHAIGVIFDELTKSLFD